MTKEMQAAVEKWQDKNFPNLTAEDNLIGALEELGELAHANLKRRQLGRDLRDNEMDAVGDIVIFLMGYCNKRGFDLAGIVNDTWAEVSQRDYTKRRNGEQTNA